MAVRSDFARHVQGAQILPLYTILAQDGYLRQHAVATLRRRVVGEGDDFNSDDLRAPEVAVARVVVIASTLPLLAPRRWVHVGDIHRFGAKDHEALWRYVDNPCGSTVLCLSGEKLDMRTKLGLRLAKAGCVFKLSPPRQQALPGWIQQHAKSLGMPIDAAASALLADLVGVELGALHTALQQLHIYAGDQPIAVSHVEALVAPTRVASIFALTDAVGQRQLDEACLRLRRALEGGEAALLILQMLARQMRQLLGVKTLAGGGLRGPDLARAVGVQPFLLNTLTGQADRYDESELCGALVALATADERLRRSGLAAAVVLHDLLVQIIGLEEASS